MPSKSSSPGPNPAATTPATKQTRSRKAAIPNTDTGRAGSAGGIVLEKEKEAKSKATPKPKPKPTPTTTEDAANDLTKSTPRRKPRKLNKEPASTTSATASKETVLTEPSATEIEALKSRVYGLEAKVEELYKSGNLDRPGRSPRRRGKGRKGSSQQQIPTLSSTKTTVDDDDDIEEIGRGDDVEEGVEELVRLEGELEVARQDLAAFQPHGKRTSSSQTRAYDEEDVEEISRDETDTGSGRHVTLSGSYRIPLPASVSVDDVKHIQSGVSAAQNVARSFLEQRRAAAAVKPASPNAASSQAPPKVAKKPARPTPRSVSSSMEVIPAEDANGKQSWSEWIGGYSVAISRAVKNIEHEAAVESQRGSSGGGGAKKKSIAGTGKRPGVKTKISGEQVDGLMS